MRDLHYDGAFVRDFNEASKKWSWATWHQTRATQEEVAQRLLEEVFGSMAEEGLAARENDDKSEE
ncbi:MAG TPA: hypothetical protein VF510_14790 [Ktedonobacterales bacterium]